MCKECNASRCDCEAKREMSKRIIVDRKVVGYELNEDELFQIEMIAYLISTQASLIKNVLNNNNI